MASQRTDSRQTFTLALVLGGFTSAVAWACTPPALVWLQLVWAAGLACAFMLGAASAWRRRHFTLWGRFGGRTQYTGLAARLWAVVLALLGAAAAFGVVLHRFIAEPSQRQMGLEWVLICAPLCLGFVLVALGAPQDFGARKRRAKLAATFLALLAMSPMVLLTGFFSLLGAYALLTGTRLSW